jgi:hypothetical protein
MVFTGARVALSTAYKSVHQRTFMGVFVLGGSLLFMGVFVLPFVLPFFILVLQTKNELSSVLFLRAISPWLILHP